MCVHGLAVAAERRFHDSGIGNDLALKIRMLVREVADDSEYRIAAFVGAAVGRTASVVAPALRSPVISPANR
jgi:hypothetical protein